MFLRKSPNPMTALQKQSFATPYSKSSLVTYQTFSFSSEDMNLLKKMLASVTSVALVLSIAVIGAPAASAGTPAFVDIGGHWAEDFIIDLSEQDIISTTTEDGTPKSMFYPNNSLTRAELTKLAIEAFYGESVDDLALAFADETSPSFTDVAPTTWYFPYVEIAKGLDIVQGFADGTFGPDLPITRSATLKVILLTGDIETMLEPASPFVDVPTGEWYYEYVSTGYNHCIINGTTPTTFTPNGNVTRAESTKILANSMKVANGEDICEGGSTGSPTPTPDGSATPTPSGVSDAVLEISLSSETPDSMSVPINGSNVPFLIYDATNKGDEDVKITGVTVSHGGLGQRQDIEQVKIFDGINQRGSTRSFSADKEIAALNLSSDPVVVKPGTTKQVVVAADLLASNSGGEHEFLITDAADITAVGSDTGGAVEVTGDFPLRGNTMRVANVSVGSLDFTLNTVADNEVEVGESDVELARIEIAAGAEEDVLLQALTLELNGADDGDIGNIYAEFQGERISNLVDFVNKDKVTIDFSESADEGWLLGDGDSRTIRIKGDILGGVNNTVTAQFDEIKSDVVAKGLTYGFGVRITENASSVNSTFTIKGGDITFAFNSSARDVAPDTDKVEFGILTIKNMGETVELRKNLTLLGQNDLAGAFAALAIKNVRLVNVETGSTFMGPEDPDGAGLVIFGDAVYIESGETLNLSLQADITNNIAVTTDKKLSFALDTSTIDVKGVDSRKTATGGAIGQAGSPAFKIKPTSNPSTKVYTIAESALTFTAKTLGNDTVVADAENVTVQQLTVRANSVGDLYIRKLTFLNTGGTATSNDVDDYSIFKKEGNVLTPLETSKSPTATAGVTFNSLNEAGGRNGILVPAGDEFTLVVTANIASSPVAGRNITLRLDNTTDKPSVEKEDGSTVLNTGVGDILSGSIIAISTSGTFAVTVDNNKTEDQIVSAGLTDQTVGVFKLRATNESVEVKDLAVLINELDTTGVGTLTADTLNDSEAIDGVTLFYYDDGTAVKKTSGQAARSGSIGAVNNIALFTDLDLVAINNENLLLEVRVDLRDMDDSNSQATARSGMAFNASLLLDDASGTTIRGVDSGSELVGIGGKGAATITADEAIGATLLGLSGFVAGEFAVGDYVVISRGLATEEVKQVTAVNPGTSITVSALVQDPLAGATVESLSTLASDSLYVFNNKVIVTKSTTQTSSIANGEREALKFDANFTGDKTDAPFLQQVKASIFPGGGVTVTDVYLYNGQNKIIAATDTAAAVSGVYTLTIGTDTSALQTYAASIATNAETVGVDVVDQISANGETYTIKAVVGNVVADPTLSTSIKVNGAPFTDGITWKDGGDNGTNGLLVNWIDLGAGSSVSQIENILSN